MLSARPTTIAECDERLERIREARQECCGSAHVGVCAYDGLIVELIACRVALIPSPRPTADP